MKWLSHDGGEYPLFIRLVAVGETLTGGVGVCVKLKQYASFGSERMELFVCGCTYMITFGSRESCAEAVEQLESCLLRGSHFVCLRDVKMVTSNHYHD